jgi:diphosphate-dependent phosphofructokinase
MAAAAAIAAPSPLMTARHQYKPRLPPVLLGAFAVREGAPTGAKFDAAQVEALFPALFGQPAVEIVPHCGEAGIEVGRRLAIGVVLSGGPAPGGHNVISGLLDYCSARNSGSKLHGFRGGPSGILDGEHVELDDAAVAPFRNQGGFHIIGSGRTKIESEEQFAAARRTVTDMGLDGLVVVGGDDSNSNAMKLAEDFKKNGLSCCVIGVPKTLDADMRGDEIEMSFGFDTTVKTYANLIANLGHDAVSARKSYHFCRVMGRSASHIALECALQVHPNLALVGEEVEANKTTLPMVVKSIADVVCERAAAGKNYGVIVIPEGLVEFMPDVDALIAELNEVLAAADGRPVTFDECRGALTPAARSLFALLPRTFADQLMLERDSHGNVQVAKIEVERLLIDMVDAELGVRRAAGEFDGKFSGSAHYLGYEGRCAHPSQFDASYCYGLGHVAAALIDGRRTGYIAALGDLTKAPEEWKPAGFPLTMMMNIERRSGHDVAVIKKKLVDLAGAPFTIFSEQRDSWRLSDEFRSPGPIQFFGPGAEDVTLTMMAEAEAAM